MVSTWSMKHQVLVQENYGPHLVSAMIGDDGVKAGEDAVEEGDDLERARCRAKSREAGDIAEQNRRFFVGLWRYVASQFQVLRYRSAKALLINN